MKKVERRPVIDQLVEEYLLAQFELEALRGRIVAQVTTRGTRPPRSEKTKRLTGIEYEATLTAGSTTTIDHEFLDGMQRVMSGEESRAFFRVFTRVPQFVVANDPAPYGCPARIRRIYRRAVQVKPRAPQLTVKKLEQAKPKRKAG